MLRCDDPLAQITHLRAGLGIGICQVKSARRLGLVRVLNEVVNQMPLWLIMHEDQADIARIRMVFDHLKYALSTWM